VRELVSRSLHDDKYVALAASLFNFDGLNTQPHCIKEPP